MNGWAEALVKIARMILTIKLDGNWSSFQLANSAPPLSVTGSAIAPSARMLKQKSLKLTIPSKHQEKYTKSSRDKKECCDASAAQKISQFALTYPHHGNL